jgi:hypothetical protein
VPGLIDWDGYGEAVCVKSLLMSIPAGANARLSCKTKDDACRAGRVREKRTFKKANSFCAANLDMYIQLAAFLLPR